MIILADYFSHGDCYTLDGVTLVFIADPDFN